jgi:hypothetical protein
VIAIRRALREEAGALTALAIRSKAHWGYDASFMVRAAADLEITPHMLEEARRFGYPTVRIQSDPNAEGFYAKMGARRIGFVESTVSQGRVLPLMEIAT